MVRHLPFLFPRAKGRAGNVMCILESERLLLRPPRPSDIPQHRRRWLGDFDVARRTCRACRIPYGEKRCAKTSSRWGARRRGLSLSPSRARATALFMGMAADCMPRTASSSSATGWASPSGAGLCHRSGAASGGFCLRGAGGRPASGPAGSTTIRPRAMCWPSWARATTARPCAIAGRGATALLCHDMLLTRADFLRKQAA